MNKIKRLKERLVYSDPSNPWVKLFFDKVRFPNSEEGHYNRIVESDGKRGVAILPYKNGAIGLVKQYRYPIDAEIWEIPRGFGDTYHPETEASRELEEETGFVVPAGQLVRLGTVFPNSGLLSSEVVIFAADCNGLEAKAPSDDKEQVDFRWVKKSEVAAKIEKSELKDSFTLCAVLLAQSKKILSF